MEFEQKNDLIDTYTTVAGGTCQTQHASKRFLTNRTMKRCCIVKESPSHDNNVPGSSSSEISGNRNMIRRRVVKKVTASHDIVHDDVHGSSSTAIDMMTNMMPTSVVKKDTASQDIACNSSSTDINATTRIMMPISSSTTDLNFPKRGFQHVYKSTSTNSSRRVYAAYQASVLCGTPQTKVAMRRDKLKMKKIGSLKEVSPSPLHSQQRTFLSTRPVFYSGTRSRILPNPIPNGIMLSAMEDLRVIDTTSGARMESATGDTVFILIPRHDAINKMTHVKTTVASLHALDKGKTSAEVRGKTRITVAEDNGKYTTVGLKPNRGSTGITEFWPKKLSQKERDTIRKLMSRCEEVAKGYLPSKELRGLRIAQLLGEWPEISGVSLRPIWGSLACGKNYYLNSHVDEDFFYSLTTVASEHGIQQDMDRYRMDAKVCNYFTFAEQGIAVALRPGDMLIFNPLYHHCLSSRTSFYESDDVFCLSLYLKTAVVGQNDNSLPVTE